MGADANVKTIQAMYEAFGRGDADAVLDRLTDDVGHGNILDGGALVWGAPWQRRRGRLLRGLRSTMEVQEFNPFAFAANETEVHTMVHCRAISRATGKSIDHDLHHFSRFQDGKVFFAGAPRTPPRPRPR